MIPQGTNVAIAGHSADGPTHQVLGPDPRSGYVRVCPLAQLGNVTPGQVHVPVTSIGEDRLVLFGEIVPEWEQVLHLDGWQIKQLFAAVFTGPGALTNEDELTFSVSPSTGDVTYGYTSRDGTMNEGVLASDDED